MFYLRKSIISIRLLLLLTPGVVLFAPKGYAVDIPPEIQGQIDRLREAVSSFESEMKTNHDLESFQQTRDRIKPFFANLEKPVEELLNTHAHLRVANDTNLYRTLAQEVEKQLRFFLGHLQDIVNPSTNVSKQHTAQNLLGSPGVTSENFLASVQGTVAGWQQKVFDAKFRKLRNFKYVPPTEEEKRIAREKDLNPGEEGPVIAHKKTWVQRRAQTLTADEEKALRDTLTLLEEKMTKAKLAIAQANKDKKPTNPQDKDVIREATIETERIQRDLLAKVNGDEWIFERGSDIKVRARYTYHQPPTEELPKGEPAPEKAPEAPKAPVLRRMSMKEITPPLIPLAMENKPVQLERPNADFRPDMTLAQIPLIPPPPKSEASSKTTVNPQGRNRRTSSLSSDTTVSDTDSLASSKTSGSSGTSLSSKTSLSSQSSKTSKSSTNSDDRNEPQGPIIRKPLPALNLTLGSGRCPTANLGRPGAEGSCAAAGSALALGGAAAAFGLLQNTMLVPKPAIPALGAGPPQAIAMIESANQSVKGMEGVAIAGTVFSAAVLGKLGINHWSLSTHKAGLARTSNLSLKQTSINEGSTNSNVAATEKDAGYIHATISKKDTPEMQSLKRYAKFNGANRAVEYTPVLSSHDELSKAKRQEEMEAHLGKVQTAARQSATKGNEEVAAADSTVIKGAMLAAIGVATNAMAISTAVRVQEMNQRAIDALRNQNIGPIGGGNPGSAGTGAISDPKNPLPVSGNGVQQAQALPVSEKEPNGDSLGRGFGQPPGPQVDPQNSLPQRLGDGPVAGNSGNTGPIPAGATSAATAAEDPKGSAFNQGAPGATYESNATPTSGNGNGGGGRSNPEPDFNQALADLAKLAQRPGGEEEKPAEEPQAAMEEKDEDQIDSRFVAYGQDESLFEKVSISLKDRSLFLLPEEPTHFPRY